MKKRQRAYRACIFPKPKYCNAMQFSTIKERQDVQKYFSIQSKEKEKTMGKPQNRKTKAGGKFEKARLRSNNNLGVKTFRNSIAIVQLQVNLKENSKILLPFYQLLLTNLTY